MPLEPGDYIDDLVPTNPDPNDQALQGDDHIRLVKQILKNALPGNTAPLTFVGNLSIDGNGSFTGTVNGRDVGADGAKLDGIESNATADQTGAEIKALYEAEPDTNAFTDAEKTKLGNRDANGQITSPTTVDGEGILAVTQAANGDFTVTFENAATAKDDQTVFVSADNTGFNTNQILYAGQAHVSTTQARILNVQITGSSVTGFNAFPIDILRFLR